MDECSSSQTGFTLGTEQEEHKTDLIFMSEDRTRQGEISGSDRSNAGWEQLPRKPIRVGPRPAGIKQW
jgi:hypothetical protein